MSPQSSIPTNIVPADSSTEEARIQYLMRAALSGLRVAVPVKVMAVTTSGGIAPIGRADVKPLVDMVDAAGNIWPHGTIHNVPYMRIQGGANAVIIDPVVGDIGIATVCDRDISTIKATGASGSPGSNRKNDLSDMVYLMTIIGAAPTQYVQFNASGITLSSPGTITIHAPTITLVGQVNQSGGTITAATDVVVNSKSIAGHIHSGVTTGSGDTGGMV